jgi:hypothetical protein
VRRIFTDSIQQTISHLLPRELRHTVVVQVRAHLVARLALGTIGCGCGDRAHHMCSTWGSRRTFVALQML